VRSLRQLYLEPLAGERDGGEVLRETLRAYFEAERNVSSAAAALGVKRHTVTNRLRAAEEKLGRSLNVCAGELDVALHLEDLGSSIAPHISFSRG
jgi:DNA-binding PucR family transcriptional regulator